MAISNTTLETINFVLDAQVDSTQKFLLLGIVTVYSFFTLWYFSNKFQVDMLWKHYFKLITIPLCKVWLFVGLPWSIILLDRGVTFWTLMRPVITGYTIATSVFFVLLLMWGTESIKEFFSGDKFYKKR